MKTHLKTKGFSKKACLALFLVLTLFCGLLPKNSLKVKANAVHGTGDPYISEASNQFLYALAGADANELIPLLQGDLWNHFFAEWPMYGFAQIEEASQIDVVAQNSGNPIGAITAYGADGTTTTSLDVYAFTVNWGTDDADPSINVTSTVEVIALSNEEQFIVATNFDPQSSITAAGKRYHLREANIPTDQVELSDDSKVDGKREFLIKDSYSNVAFSGMGLSTWVKNTDGMYSFEFGSTPERRFLGDENKDYSGTVRIVNSSETYVVVSGTGETQTYDGLGINCVSYDKLWRTGANAEALVFIGDSDVYIEPASYISATNNAIASVVLKDASQATGVTLDASDLSKVKLTFSSNFYNVIPITITYADGTVRDLTIKRVGLVIHYTYLVNNGLPHDIYYDNIPGAHCYVSFDASAGEDIIIYATYYHPSNDNTVSGGNDLYLDITYDDGHHEIIGHTDATRGFDGHNAAMNGGVETTSFVIGFNSGVTSRTFENKWGNAGGFSALVINSGYDDKTTFGGAQIGSGKGVYWDGSIIRY